VVGAVSDRKVSVTLALKIREYQANAGAAAASTEKLKGSFESLGRSGKTSAKGIDGAGLAAEAASAKLKQHELAVSSLDRRIQATSKSITGMARAFATTGDPKILAGLKKQQSALRDLEGVRKLIPDPRAFNVAGVKSGQGFLAGLAGSVSQGGGGMSAFIPALVAGGVVAADRCHHRRCGRRRRRYRWGHRWFGVGGEGPAGQDRGHCPGPRRVG
jgi:hypothetical protein